MTHCVDDRNVMIGFEPDGSRSVPLGMGIVFHGTAAWRNPLPVERVRTQVSVP